MNTDTRHSLGEHLNFKNGKKSLDRTPNGQFQVFGSNGEIGRCDQINAQGPVLVIGRVGSYCGSLYFSEDDAWVTDNAIICTSKAATDTRFWYYALQTLDLNGRSSGSGQPLINQSILNSIPYDVPTLRDRLAIAELLGALDDKIEANIKVANSAYNLAQARWSRVVLDSQSRVEWKTIGSLGTVVTGKTPPTSNSNNYDGKTPFVTISDMRSGIHILHSERTLSSAGVSTVQNALLPPGAILMSCIATVGEVAITTRPSVTNQQINALIPDGKYDPMFIYLGFRHVGRELESRGSGGSVYTNVSKSAFSSIQIPILPYPQQIQVIAEMDEVEKAMRIQNMTLARTRDELLPRLMSGKLRVKEAEAVVSQAT